MKISYENIKPWAVRLNAQASTVLEIPEAFATIASAFSPELQENRDVYAIVVHEGGQERSPWAPHVLLSSEAFLETYRLGVERLERKEKSLHAAPRHLETIEIAEESLSIYWGSATLEEVREKIRFTPGVYVIPSHVDSVILDKLRLPVLPSLFRKSPLVIHRHRKDGGEPLLDFGREYLKLLKEPIEIETRKEPAPGLEENTLEWRKRFIAENRCLTSAEVAEQAGSVAKNSGAIASRWAKEKKIFAVRYNGQNLFPGFQFHHGIPLEIISDVIHVFPEHSSGWDIAFFFTTVNSFVGCKPLELLKTNPKRLVSLAHAFVHPADAF